MFGGIASMLISPIPKSLHFNFNWYQNVSSSFSSLSSNANSWPIRCPTTLRISLISMPNSLRDAADKPRVVGSPGLLETRFVNLEPESLPMIFLIRS